ncbi:MAG: Rieske 2Fe-2S domain-containing protein [Beijerinckiaceae bacterium]|nr:Rieske 2Fe-2S domain-containing protein [Beijerinckiaceae bacterium]
MAIAHKDFIDIGPDALAGRFLRSFWQPVFLSEKIAPGRALPLQVLDERFTIYRGQSGKVVIVGERCAHRGSRLSVGRVEGDCIACIYHGWTYNADGQCVGQPAEKRGFAHSVKIRSCPTREYHGLVFAYLGHGEPPQFPQFDVLESEGIVEARESRRPYPFFNQLENSVDEVHFNFTHRSSAFTDAGLNDEIPDVTGEETEYGIVRYGRRGNAVRTSHILMPNCMYAAVYGHEKGWTDHFAWRVPLDREVHSTFSLSVVHKTGAEADVYRQAVADQRAAMRMLEPADDLVDRIMRGELHLDDVPDRPDLLFIQDAVAMKAQGSDVRREDDLLATSDLQVRILRNIWNRELTAIEEGRPLTPWRFPSSLPVTKGVDA